MKVPIEQPYSAKEQCSAGSRETLAGFVLGSGARRVPARRRFTLCGGGQEQM